MNPRVSIVLPTHNRLHTLPRAVESIRTQTFKQWELIIVDDASADDTPSYAATLDDTRIRYHRLPTNKGAGNARNFGVSLAQAEWIAFQDSDDEWHSDKLQKQFDAADAASEDVGMIYTDMLRVFTDGTTRRFETPITRRGHIMDPHQVEYQVLGIGQQSTLIRSLCFQEIGNFDVSLPRFIDLEFFARLCFKYETIRIAEPLVTFYETPGISSNHQAGIKARELLVAKFKPHLTRKFESSQQTKIAEAQFKQGKSASGLTALLQAFAKHPANIETVRILYRYARGRYRTPTTTS